ncbi:MAG: AAA family ATPase [Candidatus Omnitrophota bacterium]
MYLKKLEILGFKSFAEKTALHFEPGITAVVGPNGCGKSNIFDSIRWVLGEQSVKSMRGSKMEDVIFSGTDLRPPVGFAEVNLTFSNEKKILPLEETDVTVTRRLYRSGDSEYFINKALVRLKDIVELFMGTGIGAESYSLVEQGKMDLILSSRPEDRRLIFDEASGITKYKSQKREALNKLEDTEQNLVRINDIILEVKRQIDSLERQATKARRYKEIFDELKQAEISLANFQIAKINKELELLTKNYSKESETLSLCQDELAALDAALIDKKEKLSFGEAKINQTKDQLVILENSIKNDLQHMDITKERIKEIAVRLKSLVKLKSELDTRIKDGQIKVDEHKSQVEHTQNLFLLLKEEINKKEGLLKETIEVIKSTEKNIIQEKTNILDLTTELSRLKNSIIEINVGIQNINVRKKRLELENEKTNQEKAVVEQSYNDLNSLLTQSKSRFDILNTDRQNMQDELTKLSDELISLNKSCQDLENQKIKLESQREFIEKLKTEYEGLEQKLNAVILVQDLPSGITGILARVNNTENLSGNVKQDFQNFNYLLHCDAKPIPLETESITNRIEEITNFINNTKNLILDKKSLTEAKQVQIRQLDRDIQSQGIEVANLSTRLEGIELELNKLKQEGEIVAFEIEDLSEELKNLNTRNNDANIKLKQLDESLVNSNKLISDYQIILQEKLYSKEELLISITQDKTEFDGLEDKLNSQKDALSMLEVTYNNDIESLNRYTNEENDSNNKLEDFNRLIQELEIKIKNNLAQKQEIDSGFIIIKEEFNCLEIDFRNSQADKEKLVIKIEDLKNNIHKVEMGQKTFEFQKLNLLDKMQQLYRENINSDVKQAEDIDESSICDNINNLKSKLQRYEGASISTIEEFDELKKRFEFLLAQQDDLVKAKDSIQEAIAKINRTTRKIFVETFDKIAEEFKNYFKYLFNGGDASVFLIDENNPLDSGIEIICRPPGKKLQNILLLSGGEKALSATALMFAIFKVKPSPFCVLDEIDAPLDEANVDRFSRVLQEFTKESQFIVITHNKKTMANANVMYGITMQEQGVSRIVSVKLSKALATDEINKEDTAKEEVMVSN